LATRLVASVRSSFLWFLIERIQDRAFAGRATTATRLRQPHERFPDLLKGFDLRFHVSDLVFSPLSDFGAGRGRIDPQG
jgi:hypothetical protein